jgi:hypothetical protein
MATKTHKDRVHEFNEKLEQLSEHHDIPKVRNALREYYDTSPTKYYVYRSDQGDNGHPPRFSSGTSLLHMCAFFGWAHHDRPQNLLLYLLRKIGLN